MNAVIFDMDGVLFDTERLAVKCWDEIGEKCGLGKVGYMVLKTLGRTREESVKIFKKEFDNFDNDLFQKHYSKWLENYYAENPVPVKEGVFEILEYLKKKGYKTAVASSSSKDSVFHHLNSAGITKYFDEIICGDMIEKSKPEPDIYLAAAKALAEAPESCYAVEDSKSGIISAKRAGCTVVYVPDLYKPDYETQKYIDLKFDNLKQFKSALERALNIGI